MGGQKPGVALKPCWPASLCAGGRQGGQCQAESMKMYPGSYKPKITPKVFESRKMGCLQGSCASVDAFFTPKLKASSPASQPVLYGEKVSGLALPSGCRCGLFCAGVHQRFKSFLSDSYEHGGEPFSLQYGTGQLLGIAAKDTLQVSLQLGAALGMESDMCLIHWH